MSLVKIWTTGQLTRGQFLFEDAVHAAPVRRVAGRELATGKEVWHRWFVGLQVVAPKDFAQHISYLHKGNGKVPTSGLLAVPSYFLPVSL